MNEKQHMDNYFIPSEPKWAKYKKKKQLYTDEKHSFEPKYDYASHLCSDENANAFDMKEKVKAKQKCKSERRIVLESGVSLYVRQNKKK